MKLCDVSDGDSYHYRAGAFYQPSKCVGLLLDKLITQLVP